MKIPDRYNKENLTQAIYNPEKFVEEIFRIIRPPIHKTVGKKYFELKHGDGIDVMSKDWDNLIILDACRYDVFEQVNTISGELTSIISKGSHSEEFIKKNFSDRELHDTVYVTANAHGARINQGVFHDMLTSFSSTDINDTIHKDNRSAELINEKAIKAHELYPNKRLIVHYMQPHAPHYSEVANHIRDFLRYQENILFRSWDSDQVNLQSDGDKWLNNLNYAAKEGYISSSLLKYIYIKNLENVIEYAEYLIDKLDGKTVITSDHGELFDEAEFFILPGLYNHHRNIYDRTSQSPLACYQL